MAGSMCSNLPAHPSALNKLLGGISIAQPGAETMTVTTRGNAAPVAQATPRTPTTARTFGHPMDRADRLVMRGCIFVAFILPLVLMMEGGAA